MNKRQFLDSLREYLSTELPERLVSKHIGKYSEYIDDQLKEGKPENEVIGALGDPRLIAKSCVNAEKAGSDGIPGSSDDPDFSGEMRQGYGQSCGQNSSPYASQNGETSGENTKKHSSGGCLVPFIVLIVILLLIVAGLAFVFVSGLWVWLLLGFILICGIIGIIRML